MKQLQDITHADLETFQKHKRLLTYDPNDVAEIDNLMRTWINPHHSTCSGCSGSLRGTKDTVNSFFATHRDEMTKYADKNALRANNSVALPVPPTEASEQIENKNQARKKR